MPTIVSVSPCNVAHLDRPKRNLRNCATCGTRYRQPAQGDFSATALIPLRPIPFYSKRYCVDHGREYQTEHELAVDYITQLNLEDYIGSYDPRDVLVLTDSGYDNKKIEIAIAKKQWTFIIALRKNRSVKSESIYLTTPKSKQWSHVATFFRHHAG